MIVGGGLVDKKELVNYWINSADNDFKTMENLYHSKDYHWSLFIGHLVIEKLLKAIYIRNIGSINPPRSHDLLLLADKSGIKVDEIKKDKLDLITTFNISARYPDYKESFYKKCTASYTADQIENIKELRLWLISILKNK
jgi:HEPN domain-containing protein